MKRKYADMTEYHESFISNVRAYPSQRRWPHLGTTAFGMILKQTEAELWFQLRFDPQFFFSVLCRDVMDYLRLFAFPFFASPSLKVVIPRLPHPALSELEWREECLDTTCLYMLVSRYWDARPGRFSLGIYTPALKQQLLEYDYTTFCFQMFPVAEFYARALLRLLIDMVQEIRIGREEQFARLYNYEDEFGGVCFQQMSNVAQLIVPRRIEHPKLFARVMTIRAKPHLYIGSVFEWLAIGLRYMFYE